MATGLELGDMKPRNGEAADRSGQSRVAALLLGIVVVAAPLPYAATDPTSLSILVALLGLSLLACRPRLRSRTDWLLLGIAVLVAVGYAFVVSQQLSLDRWIPVAPDTVWAQMAHALGANEQASPLQAAPLSVARNQPLFSLGHPLACLGTLVCAFVVSRSSLAAERLLKSIAWSGLAYAVYGFAAYLIDPSMVLWREKVLDRNVLNATFPNRNAAALYFGVCAVVWALLLVRSLVARGAFRHRSWWSHGLVWDRRLTVASAGFVICTMGAMLTGSRAGVTLSLIGIVTAIGLLSRNAFASRRALAWTTVPAFAAALASLLLLGGQVNERFGAHGLTGGGRWDTYVSTWHMIRDHPWFGTGLGTFRLIFPRYRSPDTSIWGVWDRAHSTPLELAAEAGVPLALIVSMAWIVVLALLLSGALRRRNGAIYPIAGLVTAAMALGHSMIDFPLQVPGLAIPVLALVGIGLAQRDPKRRDAVSTRSEQGAAAVNVNARTRGEDDAVRPSALA